MALADYSQHKLYKFQAQDAEVKSFIQKNLLDVFHSSQDEQQVLIPAGLEAQANMLNGQEIISNIQKWLDEAKTVKATQSTKFKALKTNSIFQDYYASADIFNYMSQLPGVTRQEIGQTYEKKSIPVFVFGKGNSTILINGGIHAREWISPATTIYLADYLTSNDATAVQLRDIYKFHIIPVLNIDVPFYNVGI